MDIKLPETKWFNIPCNNQTDAELFIENYMSNNYNTGTWLIYLRYKYDYEKEWTYSIEAADCGFPIGLTWFNDWWEGQQDVEYIAMSSTKTYD